MKSKLRRGWCGIIAAALTGCLWASPAAAFTTGQSADIVVGQPNMDSRTWVSPPGANTLGYSAMATVSDGKLLIMDYGNNRVLIFNTIPTASNASADIVIGQPNFTSASPNNGGLAGNTLQWPTSVSASGGRICIADTQNNRVLIYNTFPTANYAFADVVVGQPNSNTGTANNGGLGANTLSEPNGVFTDGTRLIIGDSGNNRVLIFNTIPTVNFASADVIVGQPNSYTGTGGTSDVKLTYPQGVWIAGGRLFVADTCNHRVLIYSSIPTSHGAAASYVVGQSTFTSNAFNQPSGLVSAGGMCYPQGGGSDGSRLFVADTSNHRLLFYNAIPTANGADADGVIGQVNFTSGAVNNGGSMAASLDAPYGVSCHGSQLFVADCFNYRTLIYNESTATFTRTPTYTATRTRTPTFTRTPTYTATRTRTPTPTVTRTATPTHSATRTITVTPEDTATPSATPTATVTLTAPPTGTVTPTATATPAVVRGDEVFAYPVPAAGGDVWFQYPAEGAGEVRIEIYNLTGERVQVVTDRVAAAGNGRTRWDISGTAPGIYMYRVRLRYEKREWNSEWRKLVVVKK